MFSCYEASILQERMTKTKTILSYTKSIESEIIYIMYFILVILQINSQSVIQE